jgi:hypothetical protein
VEVWIVAKMKEGWHEVVAKRQLALDDELIYQ